MCRYGFKRYKPHYVCFDCRKQFKRPTLEDVLDQQGRREVLEHLWRTFSSPREHAEVERRFGTSLAQVRAEYHELVSTCPECGERMADLGLDFKPPPQRAVRAWRSVQAADRLGHRWHTCGCDGPGFVPASRPELVRYLRERAGHSRDMIAGLERDTTLSPQARVAELNLWNERLARLEAERERERAGPF